MTNENNVLKTVKRTMSTLEVLSESKNGLTLSEASKKLLVNKTTLHGLLNTLVILGYVSNDKGRYSLSHRINLLLDNKKNHVLLMVNKYRELIEYLIESTNSTCTLSIASGNHHYMVIDYIERNYKFVDLGKRHSFFSIVKSATGNIFLAYDKPLLNSLRKGGYISNSLEKTIKSIQEKGYAVDEGSVREDTFCLAFPIIKEQGLDAVVCLVEHQPFKVDAVHKAFKKFFSET